VVVDDEDPDRRLGHARHPFEPGAVAVAERR
jgi:hypothetical protein